MDPDAADISERLAELLDADERIRAAWLFGSVARDEARATSDVDLAIWTDRELAPDECLRLRSELQRAVEGATLDVVFLREADPVLRYEVVRDGRRLFARDPREVDRFEHRTALRYLDTAHLREVQQRHAREALE